MNRNALRASTLSGVALVATVAAVAGGSPATAQPAGEWKTIKPAIYPTQLNPKTTIPAGSTAPDSYGFKFAEGCSTGPQPGTVKLRAYVEHWWPRGDDWGIYNCRTTSGGNWSEHAEGRAYDHGLNYDNADDRAAAQSLITAFTKKDANGFDDALARRFGVEQLIWNCRIWTSDNPVWRSYDKSGNDCAGWTKTDAHRDHVHIGQNWRGANQNTSAYDGFAIWVPAY
jgi:hypothetical protein